MMKSAIVFTALMALAAAAILPPHPKANSLNEMIPDNEFIDNGNYEDVQEREERESIANSFDAVVGVMRQYKNDLTNTNEFGAMENVISIPDTVTVGNWSDTFLTSIRVKGLKNFQSQNVTMSWREDSVNAENSWEKLTINGVFHFINTVGRHSGVFEIVLVDPKYSGNTSLTKNANVYAMMSPASAITFRKAIINHTKLPTVFQNEKPEFDYFIKNVVCQYVATAVASNMYNEIVMNMRHTVRPYLTYQTGKISGAQVQARVMTPVGGQLSNGNGFELKNVRLDGAKNNLAKIYFVQMNNTEAINTANVQLRLLDFAGECDYAVTAADGTSQNGKMAFVIENVKIAPTMNFNDKTVHTEVTCIAPRVENKSAAGNAQSDNNNVWKNAEKEMTEKLVEYLKQKIAEATSQTVQHVM